MSNETEGVADDLHFKRMGYGPIVSCGDEYISDAKVLAWVVGVASIVGYMAYLAWELLR